MTTFRFVKVAGAVAIFGLMGQAQAAHEGEVHAAAVPVMTHDHTTTTTTATPAMDHSAHTAAVTSDTDSSLLETITQNVASGAISGGLGVNYVGRFTFDNAMAKVDMEKGKWGTELTVINQSNGFPGFKADSTPAEAITISPLKSMSWNNTQSNPDETTTDLAKGFGSGLHAQWYLVDLSKLAAGNYYVSVKLERRDDGQAVEVIPATTTATEQTLPSDDDLVPALTVFDGYQNRGISGTWFPNQFQKTTTPFWAEMLKAENTLVGTNTGKKGFDTAFGMTNDDIAQVSGTIKLDSVSKGPKQSNRYLTIALGGDDRNTANKHDVNYKLTIKVHKK